MTINNHQWHSEAEMRLIHFGFEAGAFEPDLQNELAEKTKKTNQVDKKGTESLSAETKVEQVEKKQEKSAAEEAKDYQKQAEVQLATHRQELIDTDKHNKELDEQAKRGNDAANIADTMVGGIAGVGVGALRNSDTKPETRKAQASSQESVVIAPEAPAKNVALDQAKQEKEKKAATTEQPAETVAAQQDKKKLDA